MIRKTLTILSLIGLLLSVGLWILQLRGPITLSSYPNQTGVKWFLGNPEGSSAWIMGVPEEFLQRSSRSLKEIPRAGAPSLSPDYEYLVGFAHGHLDVCKAYFYATPNKPSSEDMILLDAAHSLIIRIHLSFPTTLFALLPAYSIGCAIIRRVRARRRMRLALCLTCGYDLRGSKDICPECGEEFDAAMFPERTLFDSREEHNVAFRKWEQQLRLSWSWRLYLMFGFALSVLLGTEAAVWWLQGMLSLWTGVSFGVGASLLSFGVVTHFLEQRSFLQHVRRELNARGIQVCLKCGYDLRGSKDICPECGQEFAKRALD